MTRYQLKSARHALGLSVEGFARFVNVEPTGRTVRRWEEGSRAIPGTVERLLELCEAEPVARRWLLDRGNGEK